MNDIDNINYPVPKKEYKVLIRCFTYNQSEYIEDALSGFSIQKTDFPFVCLVVDDASTDTEQSIIKAWMDRECDMTAADIQDIPTALVIIVPHKTNKSCTFAFYLLKQNLYKSVEKKMKHVYPWRVKCKYEAICEGDDYWIDPLKLQKQVQFLDENRDFNLVWGKARCFDQARYKFYGSVGGKADAFHDLISNNHVPTLTALFRISELHGYNDLCGDKKWPMGDYPMWLYLSTKGKIHFMDEIFAVYRILDNSASHSQSYSKRIEFLESVYDIKVFFLEHLGLKIPNDLIVQKNQETFDIAYNCGEYGTVVTLFKVIPFKYRSMRIYVKYVLSLIKALKNKLF